MRFILNLCDVEDSEAQKDQQKPPKATVQQSRAREAETLIEEEAWWMWGDYDVNLRL